MGIFVEIFNFHLGVTQEIRDRMIRAEEAAREDGYEIRSDDGNGFFTYVVVDTEAEAVLFKLKYLSA